ncbi:DUF3159 domain-containing protein [Gordonia sp. DT30]|uniref:DUF3159 domain-containing protein n=1 Tax=unclassified Gordonia (in: high G+C Gram-positive bacteria) TaxID=2657482 RepID=UPI003CF368EA
MSAPRPRVALRSSPRHLSRRSERTLVCVGISAAFALHSGQARDFFQPDLWYPPIVAVALLISCAARYPAVGVLFGLIGHRSRRWRADPYTRRLFTALTVAVAGAFLIRFGVQFAIFQHGSVGWLAVGRIATGMPLTAVMLVAIGWSFRRVERRPAPSTDADNGTNGPGTKADAPTRLPERIARLRQSCPG